MGKNRKKGERRPREGSGSERLIEEEEEEEEEGDTVLGEREEGAKELIGTRERNQRLVRRGNGWEKGRKSGIMQNELLLQISNQAKTE